MFNGWFKILITSHSSRTNNSWLLMGRYVFRIIHSKFMDEESKVRFNNKLNRAQLGALTICLGASLGMSFLVGSSSPFIGLMLGTITIGVYVMIVSGKWSVKNT